MHWDELEDRNTDIKSVGNTQEKYYYNNSEAQNIINDGSQECVQSNTQSSERIVYNERSSLRVIVDRKQYPYKLVR